jgi:hypothetical protein
MMYRVNLPLLVLLQDTNLLQGLEDLAVDGARGIDVVGWARTTVDSTTVNLVQGTDTNALADVDVTGNRGGTDKVPIGIIRSQFLVGTGLDNIDPLGDFELTGTLKIGGVGLDEG